MQSKLSYLLLLGLLTIGAAGCASLQALQKVVLPLRFEQAGPAPQVRLVGPRPDLPAGGAAVRISLRVTNPNPFGVTLSTLRASLILRDTQAATGDFPLGLPLQAGQTSEVPLDLSISFSDLPALGQVFRNAVTGRELPYHLDGTVGIDAGTLGQPTFGPMTLVSGTLRVPGAIGE